jgi:hypothetical protein
MTVAEVMRLVAGDPAIGVGVVARGASDPEFTVGSLTSEAIVWLYYPQGGDIGHWIATFNRAGRGTYLFDPYGNTAKRPQIPVSGKVIYNTINYEGTPDPQVNTCGEWAALRALNRNLSSDSFMSKYGGWNQEDIGTWGKTEISQRMPTANEVMDRDGGLMKDAIEASLAEAGGATLSSEDPEPVSKATAPSDEKPTVSSFLGGL